MSGPPTWLRACCRHALGCRQRADDGGFLELGCQMCHLAARLEAKVGQTAPIPNNGCQMCHLQHDSEHKVAQTAPISDYGCQMCHFRCAFVRDVSQMAPITSDIAGFPANPRFERPYQPLEPLFRLPRCPQRHPPLLARFDSDVRYTTLYYT